MNFKNYLLTISILCFNSVVWSQSISPSTFNASGGSASVGGNTYEWSIAEMMLVHTDVASNLTVTQGLLQNNPQPPSAIQNPKLTAELLSVYPNPTEHVLHLQPNFQANSKLKIMVLDVVGKIIIDQLVHLRVGNELQQLDLSRYTAGNYLLSVEVNTNGITYHESYKITKL